MLSTYKYLESCPAARRLGNSAIRHIYIDARPNYQYSPTLSSTMVDLRDIAVIGGTGAQGMPVVKGEGGQII